MRHPVPSDGLVQHLLAPAVGGLLVGVFARHADTPFESAVLGYLSFAAGVAIVRRRARWAALLPFMAAVIVVAGPLLGGIGLVLINSAVGLPGLEPLEVAVAAAVTALVAVLPQLTSQGYWSPERRTRIALIGSSRSAESLARELELAEISRYEIVGRIRTDNETDAALAGRVPLLGGLSSLGSLVAEHDIHLLVMTGEVSRLAVFDEIARSCLHLPVRLHELSGFYEDVFGHVPIAEINSAWFQYIMHPNYTTASPITKRVMDLVVAGVAWLLAFPVLMLAAILIKRDGGPVFFKQLRIGEAGRPFIVYKLRTMKLGADAVAQWAEPEDPRVTRIGRILRRTHLDEFPQVLNVFRGEMSVVGPRPEQPEFVERLEQAVPFYSRRHLVKPGITGWAQVRCGYAGSDIGSAWKVCHDLYYLKHRSLGLDIVTIGETIRTLVADRGHAVEPSAVPFVTGPLQLEEGPAALPVTPPRAD